MVNFKYRVLLDTNVLLDVLCTPDRPSAASSRLIFEAIHIFDIKDAILSCGKDLEDEVIFAHACEKGCDAIITSDRHFREQKAGKGPLMFTPEAFAARLCGKDYSP